MEDAFETLNITDRKIIVAIDFGTTFSGIAWAQTLQYDRRTAITSWPISEAHLDGKTSEKVPTKLRYQDGKSTEWGFQVPIQAPRGEVVEWFKLDLDPSLKPPSNTTLQNAQNGCSDPKKPVANYLAKIGEHLMYTLRIKIGEAFLNNTPIEFLLTVPAIWSDLASQRTLEACKQAGGPFRDAPIHLISEPEAAAIFSLHGLDPHGLNIGDSFVICDAGGGTVDLISYTISKLRPILEVKEAAAGSGALCGSTFLNRRFEHFLRAKLGKERGFDEEVMADAMERFEEQTKRHFSMSALPNDTFIIPVPGLANNKSLGIQRGRFFIKAIELQQIFEPVILQIIELVKGQISSSNIPIQAVLLVGGFGCSTYLRERLRNALPKETQIMQPPNAWLAVVNGAVMKGLALNAPGRHTVVDIKDRVARKHYGSDFSYRYDEHEHAAYADKKWYCGLDGCYKVALMKWFIKKGDMVSENEPFSYKFRHYQLVSDGRVGKVTLPLYFDDSGREAPKRRDSTVKMLCKVEADLGHIPPSQMHTTTGKDGLLYYDIDVKIEWVYLSKSTTFTLVYKDPIPHLKVAIVGGGPGGLATAIALSKIPNVEITVYEQASLLREVGAGISVGTNTWNVLSLLGVADTLTSGHETWTIMNLNGRSGEELSRREKSRDTSGRPPIRTQRTALQSALLAHIKPGVIQLSKKLTKIIDKGSEGIELQFKDGTVATADLVVGADGIRSVVRDTAWPDYEIKFTGTTIWRTLLPWEDVKDLDPRFGTTAWWHSPTTHVYFSPVGEGLWEIASRAWHDPEIHSASKVSWGVPVDNAHVESHFTEYLPDIREALARVPAGNWREFAAFAGPELPRLTAWDNKIVLVGDSSHALSGAFGSGAGFAMEDGWVLAQALQRFKNDLSKAIPLFDEIRLPYYSKMYAHLASQAEGRKKKLEQLGEPTWDQRVVNKMIVDGGKNMDWIYQNDIEAVWKAEIGETNGHA
ncbi:Chaperone protein DnaK [Seiridium cupressi]